MKYFTADIWAGWQGNDAEFDGANRKWKRNRTRYQAGLGPLASRLGRHGRFFTDHELHDGRLLLFAVSDWPGPHLGKKFVTPETRLEMAVLAGWRKGVIYRLFYTGVSDIVVQTKNELFPLANSRFGDWGYDELLPEKRGSYRHNILFQTGTEISVAFQSFRFEVQQATASKLARYAGQTEKRKGPPQKNL
jgi:hypothetical protein